MSRSSLVPTRALTILILLFAVVSLVACVQREIRKPVPGKIPEWCQKTAEIQRDGERGWLALGVGQVQGINTPELARAQADSKARAEVSGLFGRYLALVLQRYQGFRDEKGATGTDEQAAAAAALTKLSARGARIEDRYVDDSLDTWYALAVVPMGAFREQVAALAELSDRFKAFYAATDDAALFESLKKTAK